MAEGLRLEPIERLEDARADWDRLALATGHPFATWEWNELWWRHFGGERELYCFAGHDEAGTVRAILPLYLARSRFPAVARFLGYADLTSPLCAAEDRALTGLAMRAVTRRPHPCRVLLAERLPGSEGWGEALGGRVLDGGNDPVLALGGRTWEEVIGRRSAKSRQTLRRAERRLLEREGVTFRLATDPARLPADMDALFRLHAERWEGGTTGVFEGERGALHRDFAAAALERGWLRLWLAELDGEPVAAWYGWRFAGADWYFQAGRDPRFDRLSVGKVLFAHTIREACRDGIECYRMLAGDEGYKMDYADGDLGTETRLLGSRLPAAAGAAAWRLRAALPGSILSGNR